MTSTTEFMERKWPPSNYPIFLALVTLVATAITLSMGDESQAEQLAIYAYYLLVIGVTIRFFELALPEGFFQRLKHITDHLAQQIFKIISRNIGITANLPHIFCSRSILARRFTYISKITKNAALYLSIFFLILLVYGLIIDIAFLLSIIWELFEFILLFFTLYVFSRTLVKWCT